MYAKMVDFARTIHFSFLSVKTHFCEGAIKNPPKCRTHLGTKILDHFLGAYHHRVED
jgi:hypothetical protein